MRNISRINLIRKIHNQTLRATYYPPKTIRDIEEQNPDYFELSPDELKASYENNFVEEHKNEFWENEGISFRYKDGTEDVYTKSGYEHEVFEYLDRNFMSKKRYRLLTDDTHIDFYAGGRVLIDGIYYEIVKVINMTNDIPTQNKFRAFKGLQNPHAYAPKILALL